MRTLDPRAVRLRRAYATVWASPKGRRVLQDIIAASQLDRDPMKIGLPDGTAYLLGQQRIGRRVCAMVGKTTPEMLMELEVDTDE